MGGVAGTKRVSGGAEPHDSGDHITDATVRSVADSRASSTSLLHSLQFGGAG